MKTSEFKDVRRIQNIDILKDERDKVLEKIEYILNRFSNSNLYDISLLVRLGDYRNELNAQINRLENN